MDDILIAGLNRTDLVIIKENILKKLKLVDNANKIFLGNGNRT